MSALSTLTLNHLVGEIADRFHLTPAQVRGFMHENPARVGRRGWKARYVEKHRVALRHLSIHGGGGGTPTPTPYNTPTWGTRRVVGQGFFAGIDYGLEVVAGGGTITYAEAKALVAESRTPSVESARVDFYACINGGRS